MGEGKLTGYPSVDKPWLKYYSEEAINAPLPRCTAYELIRCGNDGHLNDIALIYFDRKITYRQLFAGIESAAKAFAALGIAQGDIVILCMVNMPETVYALYALDRLGAVANLIDPRTNTEQLRNYITECDAKIILTVDITYNAIEKAAKDTTVEKIVVVSPAESLPLAKRIAYRLKNKAPSFSKDVTCWGDFIAVGTCTVPDYAPYEQNRCFIIAHTGGTTGVPKGVMLSDDNLNAVTHGYRYLNIPFNRQDRYFNDLPPFIIYGLAIAIHTTLCYGLQVILYPKFEPKEFPRLFKRYRPNHFSDGADHLIYLMREIEEHQLDVSHLITAGFGGDILDPKVECSINTCLKEHGCQYEIVKGYGMTETCATTTTTTTITFQGANAAGSVGIPLVSNTVKIVEMDTGSEQGYDRVGEIWISSPSVMLGYYKNPEETKKSIVIDEIGNRWIRTGDLGRMNKDGSLFHEGRIRRIYVTTFEGQPAKIFPSLIEEIVESIPDIYSCIVVGRHMKDSTYYEPVGYIVLNENHRPVQELVKELRLVCSEQLPTYMRPVEYRFMQNIPHTPIGKVDFRALERMAVEEEE